MPDFVTVKEASELLPVTDRTPYDLCRQGKLVGAAKIGGQWRVRQDVLVDWAAKQGRTPADNENDGG